MNGRASFAMLNCLNNARLSCDLQVLCLACMTHVKARESPKKIKQEPPDSFCCVRIDSLPDLQARAKQATHLEESHGSVAIVHRV